MEQGKNSKKDFYEILGIKQGASINQIKRAYKKLAKENHPDTNTEDPDANEKFMKIQNAYDEILDQHNLKKNISFKKSHYDKSKSTFFEEFFFKIKDSNFSKSKTKVGAPFDRPSQYVNIKEDLKRKHNQNSFFSNETSFDRLEKKFEKIIRNFFENF